MFRETQKQYFSSPTIQHNATNKPTQQPVTSQPTTAKSVCWTTSVTRHGSHPLLCDHLISSDLLTESTSSRIHFITHPIVDVICYVAQLKKATKMFPLSQVVLEMHCSKDSNSELLPARKIPSERRTGQRTWLCQSLQPLGMH